MRRPAGIVALLGSLLVLTSDFAGWESRSSGLGVSSSPSRTGSLAQNLSFSYTSSTSYEAIGLFGPYLPLILLVAGLLGLTAYLSLRTPPPALSLPLGARPWMVPAAAGIASLGFGIVFVVAMLTFDPSDWWLDIGFFAGTIAGIAAAVMLRQAASREGS